MKSNSQYWIPSRTRSFRNSLSQSCISRITSDPKRIVCIAGLWTRSKLARHINTLDYRKHSAHQIMFHPFRSCRARVSAILSTVNNYERSVILDIVKIIEGFLVSGCVLNFFVKLGPTFPQIVSIGAWEKVWSPSNIPSRHPDIFLNRVRTANRSVPTMGIPMHGSLRNPETS